MFYCWTCKLDKPDAQKAVKRQGRYVVCQACADKPAASLTPKPRGSKSTKGYASGATGRFFSEHFE